MRGWYSPWLPQPGDLYVSAPQLLGSGTASVLPMTEADKATLKPKRPLGFVQHDDQPAVKLPTEPEQPMWEMG